MVLMPCLSGPITCVAAEVLALRAEASPVLFRAEAVRNPTKYTRSEKRRRTRSGCAQQRQRRLSGGGGGVPLAPPLRVCPAEMAATGPQSSRSRGVEAQACACLRLREHLERLRRLRSVILCAVTPPHTSLCWLLALRRIYARAAPPSLEPARARRGRTICSLICHVTDRPTGEHCSFAVTPARRGRPCRRPPTLPRSVVDRVATAVDRKGGV